jgi:hypothetical protein
MIDEKKMEHLGEMFVRAQSSGNTALMDFAVAVQILVMEMDHSLGKRLNNAIMKATWMRGKAWGASSVPPDGTL